ncbi:MAG: hypothetical protein U9R19_16865 [Bacteroidota bacterium]|nr:hypothetical protein [Bacteroidota bacterium]
MDFQTRKLNAIAYLISLNDEAVFQKIETSILESMNPVKADFKLSRLSTQELISLCKKTPITALCSSLNSVIYKSKLLSLKISQALFLTLSYQRLLKTGVFVQALINRAVRSEQDYRAGRYVTQEQLEQDSENW